MLGKPRNRRKVAPAGAVRAHNRTHDISRVLSASFSTMTTALAAGPGARRPVACLSAFAAALLLGLASRHGPVGLALLLGKYPGDVLWATMICFGVAALRPRDSPRRIAAIAAATCLAVEVCKLWQAPWLEHLRHTTLGHLVLGHVFSWQNLVAYAAGVLLGSAVDTFLLVPTSGGRFAGSSGLRAGG